VATDLVLQAYLMRSSDVMVITRSTSRSSSGAPHVSAVAARLPRVPVVH
jgi:hypothetical protein